MNNSEILRLTNNLINQLQMRGEYSVAAGMAKKVLIVEGKTDHVFIDRIKRSDVRCFHVQEFVTAMSAFSTKPTSIINSKDVIVSILQRLAKSPEFFSFPKGSEKWPLFGMVDNDFDDASEFQRLVKLFFTDTHDIETLILSTDKDVVTRIDSCSVTREDLKIALFLAYQLSCIRQALYKEGTFLQHDINEKDGTVNFQAFVEDTKIDLSAFLSYINSKIADPLSAEKLRKVKSKITTSLKKNMTPDGLWKNEYVSFNEDAIRDFWLTVNGHDILSALRYVNNDFSTAFSQSMYSQNRSFELSLCANYDTSQFCQTQLYDKLFSSELIEKCS